MSFTTAETEQLRQTHILFLIEVTIKAIQISLWLLRNFIAATKELKKPYTLFSLSTFVFLSNFVVFNVLRCLPFSRTFHQ